MAKRPSRAALIAERLIQAGVPHPPATIDRMMIKRIIPNVSVTDAAAGHEFYTEFLGLEKAFDLGWIASFRSPATRPPR
jgi:hypothetical protein